jgi:phosphoribosylformimino-5-aminoimidazole carboxamide ribotide isomerase
MDTMNIIPAIDLKDGKCVRLFQGDFEKSTEYSNDPTEVARLFAELATTNLHIVDLDGAQTGEQKNREIVKAIAAESNMKIQLGGGVRDDVILKSWLDVGVQRCVIGSLAITQPDTVKAWITRYGGDKIVLALDVRYDAQNEPIITTHGWTQDSDATLFECIDDFMNAGLRHVLCTDVSRDGAMSGPNFELYKRVVRTYPELQLQASGGVRNIDDMNQLRQIGVPAAISGRALLDGKISAQEIAAFQLNA